MWQIYSFKIFHGDDVRRFSIKVPPKSEDIFRGLTSQVQYLFGDDNLVAAWKDEDGDLIRITSPIELDEAFKYTEAIPLKLFTLPGKAKLENLTETPKPQEKVEEEPISVEKFDHKRVMCDGCDKSVVGIRYKCLVCEDYDLCETCEHKYVHPEHGMVRMVDDKSVIPPLISMNLFKRKHLSRGFQMVSDVGRTITNALTDLGIDSSFEVRTPDNKPVHFEKAAPATAPATAPASAPAPQPQDARKTQEQLMKEYFDNRNARRIKKAEHKAAKREQRALDDEETFGFGGCSFGSNGSRNKRHSHRELVDMISEADRRSREAMCATGFSRPLFQRRSLNAAPGRNPFCRGRDLTEFGGFPPEMTGGFNPKDQSPNITSYVRGPFGRYRKEEPRKPLAEPAFGYAQAVSRAGVETPENMETDQFNSCDDEPRSEQLIDVGEPKPVENIYPQLKENIYNKLEQMINADPFKSFDFSKMKEETAKVVEKAEEKPEEKKTEEPKKKAETVDSDGSDVVHLSDDESSDDNDSWHITNGEPCIELDGGDAPPQLTIASNVVSTSEVVKPEEEKAMKLMTEMGFHIDDIKSAIYECGAQNVDECVQYLTRFD